jgi:hypothetical protein
MITLIKRLPANVIGFTFSGRVTGEDYETVVFPAVKKARKQTKDIRLLIEFEKNFKSLSLKAMLDDAFIGFKHLFSWKRIAIVSNNKTIQHAIKAFSFLIIGQLKIFHLSEKDKAIEWISKK